MKKEDGALWVTIHRAQVRNALALQTNRELQEVAKLAAADSTLRAVFLTGDGDKAFCAGADLKERKGVSAEDTHVYVDAIAGAINAWADIPQPTFALMNGSAFGGGLELALACDFRFAHPRVVFGLTEVRLGILPGAGGTQRLPRVIGMAAAKEMILLGRRIDASRALSIGLVSCVTPELAQTARQWLGDVVACAPLSVQKAKQAIDRGWGVPLAEGLQIERQCYDVTLFSDDRNEGLLAFSEKRSPRWSGK